MARRSDAERRRPLEATGRLKGTSQEVERAGVPLQADADGPGWTDRRTAEAHRCRVRTVGGVRRRLCAEGFGPERARAWVRRIRFRRTPRRGSPERLREQPTAWSEHIDPAPRGVDRRVKVDGARVRLEGLCPKTKP